MNSKIKRINSYIRHNSHDKLMFHSKNEILIIEKKHGTKFTYICEENNIKYGISFKHYGTIPTELILDKYPSMDEFVYDFKSRIPHIETVEEVITPIIEFLKNYDQKYDIEYHESLLEAYYSIMKATDDFEEKCQIRNKIVETETYVS